MMAGNRHQSILGLIIKKMREDGFSIYGVDGKYPGFLGEKVDLPPQILRYRPDAIGINNVGQVCIGEAKTENDILNKRTYAQLCDFTAIELNGKPCEVYVGVTRSSEDIFVKILKRIGLDKHINIHILYIPDDIIND